MWEISILFMKHLFLMKSITYVNNLMWNKYADVHECLKY